MIYLLETKLPENKSVVFALKCIFGLGKSQTIKLCKNLGFSSNFKVNNLSNEQINKLLKLLDSSTVKVTSDLKKFQMSITKRLITIKSYRGLRKIKGLPVRGQRTHTNSKTARKFRY